MITLPFKALFGFKFRFFGIYQYNLLSATNLFYVAAFFPSLKRT